MSNVVKAFPPNYKEICKAIPGVLKNKAIVFAYGDTIYNPAGAMLQMHFLAHEQTHLDRQSGNPDEWWSKYLSDVQFRLDEEVVAYRVQYQYAVEFGSRADRRNLLKHIANDLSGPMYGNLVNREQAIKLITNEEASDEA
jgi:hypothetical protein